MQTGSLHDGKELGESNSASSVPAKKEKKFLLFLPVKELKGSPVEGVRFAEVRLKGDKLVEGNELGAILALVQDSTEQSKRLLVVVFLRELSQESDDKVLIGEKLFSTLGDAGVLGENLFESLQVCSLNIALPHHLSESTVAKDFCCSPSTSPMTVYSQLTAADGES